MRVSTPQSVPFLSHVEHSSETDTVEKTGDTDFLIFLLSSAIASAHRKLLQCLGGRGGGEGQAAGRWAGMEALPPMKMASSELCSRSRASINSQILTATSEKRAVLIHIL